jgi:stage II sporulation protein AA (anti-sigma F factor antagonist)
MNVECNVAKGVPLVRVMGEVDMSNCDRIDTAVTTTVTNQAFALVLDLSGVTYLDSAGVRLLYQLDARLDIHQQRLVVVVPAGANIMRTLQAAGVIGSLVLTSSLDAAMLIVESPRPSTSHSRGHPNGTTG